MKRRNSRKVRVGDIYIGGDAKITVQSMLNKPALDIEGSVRQAIELEKAGCEIIRAAVPDMAAVELIRELKANLSVPVVADIHFDYRLALASIDAGVDKIRINPGNIGSMERVKAVADACRKNNVPIRIGVNSGSLEKEILAKYGSPCAEALAESALGHVSLLEQCDFYDTVISIKSSDVNIMTEAYRTVASKCDYPLHLGVTEAGLLRQGLVKNAIGIGSLLLDGIGDTIRVSLTSNPVDEVYAAKDILVSLGLKSGVQFVSCPKCGRCSIDLETIATQVYDYVKTLNKNIKVAVMGCEVNGPGECKDADIGIAGANGGYILFKHGQVYKRIAGENVLQQFIEEVNKL